MYEFSDVLVVAPHADDESYGCGGSIARIKSLGGQVFVVLATVADVVHYGKGVASPKRRLVSGQTRIEEFEAVMEYLKVDDWDLLIPDSTKHLALDTVPRKELVDLLESSGRLAIDRIEPTMIMLPASSYNQDHEALHQACITATRPGSPGSKHLIPFVLAYDGIGLFWTGDHQPFYPNLYIDVSAFLDTKINALRMHESQMRDPAFHGSPESWNLATQVRGREVGIEAAEGFEVLRALF
jgi:N-acetylglucosamine malate deacetylase 1